MDRTQEILDFLLAEKGRVVNAITLIEDTQKSSYEHALAWYEDVRRAAEYTLEHSYYDIQDQFDINGSWDIEGCDWFPGSPKFNFSYGDGEKDNADWTRISDALYASPYNPHRMA